MVNPIAVEDAKTTDDLRGVPEISVTHRDNFFLLEIKDGPSYEGLAFLSAFGVDPEDFRGASEKKKPAWMRGNAESFSRVDMTACLREAFPHARINLKSGLGLGEVIEPNGVDKATKAASR